MWKYEETHHAAKPTRSQMNIKRQTHLNFNMLTIVTIYTYNIKIIYISLFHYLIILIYFFTYTQTLWKFNDVDLDLI